MGEVNERETTDTVIEETRKIKEILAASLDFDIDRILDDARNKQKQSRRTVIPAPIRRAT